MATTAIEWTDVVWNPVTGCTKVSAGCKHCYAETFANRQMGPWKGRAFTDVRCHEDRLAQPLRWRKPRRVFVNSMSDLFHPDVHRDFVLRVFLTMAQCPRHTFQILTKRPERMRTLVAEWLEPAMTLASGSALQAPTWPLPNVWLGVSVENQATADTRIPLLLQTPAALRFVSCEPLLEPVHFPQQNPDGFWPPNAPQPEHAWLRHKDWPDDFQYWSTGLNWVIVGGESGPAARPCDVAWIHSIVQQCQAASVPCFVKQLGARPRGVCSWTHHNSTPPKWLDADGCIRSVSRRPTSDEFDLCHAVDDAWWPCAPKLKSRKGADPSEWPEDLRVREMPGK